MRVRCARRSCDANAHLGLDTIAFNIPGAGIHAIAPATDLPAVTDPVLIDGYTQPGTTQNTAPFGTNAVLLIELDGGGTLEHRDQRQRTRQRAAAPSRGSRSAASSRAST